MVSTAALVGSAARLRRLRDEPAWSLLRATNAHTTLALLRAHFVDSGEPRVPAALLFERLADDVEELRRGGFDLPQVEQVSQVAGAALHHTSKRSVRATG